MAKCKSCGADIIFIKTANGKAMPCDAQDATGVGYVPHWATCPHAAKFRGGKR